MVRRQAAAAVSTLSLTPGQQLLQERVVFLTCHWLIALAVLGEPDV
jgi:hypothetical protein